MPREFIVVPESLEADTAGRPTGRPSFVFRQVLDAVAPLAGAGDSVYLAPANSFGGPVTEEQAAWNYLRTGGEPAYALLCPGVNLGEYRPDGDYVDTWGNAVRLARVVDIRDRPFELVVACPHARRARWCFERAGYTLACVHEVEIRREPARVVRRTFYYRYPWLHRTYEALALVRDRWKYG